MEQKQCLLTFRQIQLFEMESFVKLHFGMQMCDGKCSLDSSAVQQQEIESCCNFRSALFLLICCEHSGSADCTQGKMNGVLNFN